MAENTEHFKWITTIEGCLENLCSQNDNIFSEQLEQEQQHLAKVNKQVEAERKRTESEYERAEYLSAKLKELGVDPENLFPKPKV